MRGGSELRLRRHSLWTPLRRVRSPRIPPFDVLLAGFRTIASLPLVLLSSTMLAWAMLSCATLGLVDGGFSRASAAPSDRAVPQTETAEPTAHGLEGLVRSGDQPVRGARVTIFAAGQSIAQGWTDAEGRYSLSFRSPIGRGSAGADPTIFVACVPPGEELAPEYALVRASARARELELWSPCFPRVALDARWDVELRTHVDQRAALRECWAHESGKGGGAQTPEGTPQH